MYWYMYRLDCHRVVNKDSPFVAVRFRRGSCRSHTSQPVTRIHRTCCSHTSHLCFISDDGETLPEKIEVLVSKGEAYIGHISEPTGKSGR
jgi:hypothetical protein